MLERDACLSKDNLYVLDGALHYELEQMLDALQRMEVETAARSGERVSPTGFIPGYPNRKRGVVERDNKHLLTIADLISWLEYQIIYGTKICGAIEGKR
jgi:hypothetical protein